jgi:hypothetical protein
MYALEVISDHELELVVGGSHGTTVVVKDNTIVIAANLASQKQTNVVLGAICVSQGGDQCISQSACAVD